MSAGGLVPLKRNGETRTVSYLLGDFTGQADSFPGIFFKGLLDLV